MMPALQGSLLRPGHRLGFANLHYRGAAFDLELEVGSGSVLTARLTPASPIGVSVVDEAGPVAVDATGRSVLFPVRNGQRSLVSIGRKE